nr:sensor histidine kinase [uncultured Carboxylicivirga sp.]
MFKNRPKYLLPVIYSILWVGVLYTPSLFVPDVSNHYWGRLLFEWFRIIPFLLFFLLNAFVLVPYLFKKGRYPYYLIVTAVLAGFISFAVSTSVSEKITLFGVRLEGPIPLNQRRPPMGQNPEMDRGQMPPQREGLQQLQNQPFPGRPLFVRLAGNFITAFLMLGLFDAIYAVGRLTHEEKQRMELEKQQLKTELDFLKHQISPHFFMNTLNNIHALVDLDKTAAQSSIIRLSRMMRYLLYESDKGYTTIKKEIEFTKSFLQLMGIRYPEDKVFISGDYPEIDKDFTIPAFLFVSYIENAFKHGINPNGSSYIHVELRILNEQALQFRICNSNHPVSDPQAFKSSGVGLVNSLQRLKLLYGDNFELTETTINDEYCVNLIIPINATEKLSDR